MKITIVGTGYVGLVTAAVLADAGHSIICVDVDAEKIKKLNNGENVLFEPGLGELLVKNRSRLAFVTDSVTAYKDPEIIMIAVGTPELPDGSADLRYVYAAIDSIIAHRKEFAIIVIKSTVPIGTNDALQQYCDAHTADGAEFEIVSNPEFLSQGTAVNDTIHASRIIIGADSDIARSAMCKMYEAFDCPVVLTDRCSAEMIKYASNDFLALKVSYINEIANLCEALGANIEDVSLGMGMDPRIGKSFLRAGIGYGGSCFPKDTKALHWLSKQHDRELTTIKAAVEVNKHQKTVLIEKARKHYPSFNGLNVAILGLSFKPGTDDLREAPSIANADILLAEGANVKVWDPVAMDNFAAIYQDRVEYCECITEALRDADICFIMTEWREVTSLSLDTYSIMRRPIVLDGRNCYDIAAVREANIIYDSIGR